MKTYEITDFYGNNTFSLMGEDPIIEAKTGREALKKYIKEKKYSIKVKVSADRNVIFKVTPVVFDNGRKYIDRRNGQRAMWYAQKFD